MTTPPPWTRPPHSPLIRLDLFPAKIYSIPRSPLDPLNPIDDDSDPNDPSRGHARSRGYVSPRATLLYERARAIITLDSIYIFQDSPEGPTAALQSRLDDIEGNRRLGIRLTLSDPTTHPDLPPRPDDFAPYLVIMRGSGCACGSRLLSFRPFTTHTFAPAQKRLS